MRAMVRDGTLPPCSECGTLPSPDDRGHLPYRRVGGWSLLRLVPAFTVLLAIAALFRYGGESSPRRTAELGIPSLITPHVTSREMAAIVDGSATPELEGRWQAAMEAIVASAESMPERTAFVTLGAIEPPPTLREDWGFGWPASWAWAVRHISREDTIAAMASDIPRPDDEPFQYLPKIPTKRLDVLGSSLLPWTYVLMTDGENEWRLEPSSIRWDDQGPRQQQLSGTVPVTRRDYRTSALLITNWSVPILGAWLLWTGLRLLPGFRRKRWRLAALLVVAAAISPFLGGVTQLLNRGWSRATAPALGWADAPLLPPFVLPGAVLTPNTMPRGPWLHREEIRTALATPASRRAFAAHVAPAMSLAKGPTASAGPRYLVAGTGGPWQVDMDFWRSVSIQGFTLVRTVDVDIPTEVAALDPGAGLDVRWRSGSIDLRWRGGNPSEPSYRLMAAVGPIGWFLIALLLAWSLPAAIVEAFRRRRARRRYAAGLCPVCTHPLALASPTPVRSSV